MPADSHAITGVATSIAVFIGSTGGGPADKAVAIASLADYERTFGSADASAPLGPSVRHFFENGGTDAYIIRLASADGAMLAPGSDAFHSALLSDTILGDTGILALIDLFNLICVPGETHVPTLAKLQTYCARRRAFLLLDADPCAAIDAVIASASGDLANAANAAIFFPWLRAPDGDVPPCGFVAGIFARNDSQRGVWRAAAGLEATLVGAAGPSVTLSEHQAEQLNAAAINTIRKLPNAGTVVWGARTLAGRDGNNSDWKYIPVRRFALFLEESIARGTQWAAFEPNGEPLWAALRENVGDFLFGLFKRGAFQGATPSQGYFVRCDSGTTGEHDIGNGIVNIVIGFAALRRAEFILIRISQSAAKPAT